MADPLLDKLRKLQKAIQGLQAETEALSNRNAALETENADLRLKAEEAEKNAAKQNSMRSFSGCRTDWQPTRTP